MRPLPLPDARDHVTANVPGHRINTHAPPPGAPSGLSSRGASQDMTQPLKMPSPNRNSISGQSRTAVLRSKIRELEAKVDDTQRQLDAAMRTVRNIAILTPFQKSTRDRLQSAIVPVAKAVRQLRIDHAKVSCYREVLAKDFNAELRERRSLVSSCDSLPIELHSAVRATVVPLMTISMHDGDQAGEDMLQSDPLLDEGDDKSSRRADSSICGSFHSALDFNVELSSSSLAAEGAVLDRSPLSSLASTLDREDSSRDFGTVLSVDSSLLDIHYHSTVVPQRSDRPYDSGDHEDQLQSTTSHTNATGSKEEAEEWDKTRAAKRVSLVKIPVGLKAVSRND